MAHSSPIGTIVEVLITLPLASPPPDAPPPQNTAPWATPPRVLLAEDNDINRKVAYMKLKAIGCDVTTAVNGEEAVHLCEQTTFDLIFMDLQMPLLNGIEAATRILQPLGQGMPPNEHPADNLRTPIIALTAHSSFIERKKCVDAGMVDYITKPFKTSELRDALLKHLPPSSSPCQPETPLSTGTVFPHAATIKPVVFDRNIMMENFDGDVDTFTSVASVFLRQIPDIIAAMRSAVETGDLKSYKDQAHSLKGVTAQLGAEQLRTAAQKAEEFAVQGDVAAMDTQLTQLTSYTEELMRQLHQDFKL